MKLKKITETEFNRLDISRRIIVNDASYQYAVIDLGKKIGTYGLSWGSDIIQPIIQKSEDNQFIWIGVDQKLAMIRLSDGQVNLNMSLHTPVLKLLLIDNLIAVLTELEVMLFNSNGLLKTSLGLPDLAEDIILENDNFLIYLFDGSTLTLNPDKFIFDVLIENHFNVQNLKLNIYKYTLNELLNKIKEDFLLICKQKKLPVEPNFFSLLNRLNDKIIKNHYRISMFSGLFLLLCFLGFYITYKSKMDLVLSLFFLVLIPLIAGFYVIYLYYFMFVEYNRTREPENFIEKVLKDLEYFINNYSSIYNIKNIEDYNLASSQENQMKIESIKNIIERLKQKREEAQGKFSPFLPIFVILCIPLLKYFALGNINSSSSIPVLETTFYTLGLLLGNWFISIEYQNDLSKFNDLLSIIKEYLNNIKLVQK